MKKTLIWLFAWGAAFGYLEAAVVVYLRAIYYPEGFAFPLTLMEGRIFWTEIGREAATLLVLAATAVLSFPRLQSRMAAFVLLFGVWDIFYYVFLKLLLGWPQSLLTPDILFLIPAPWVGPVYAPLLVSAGFIAAGTAVLVRNARGRVRAFGRSFVLLETAAGFLFVASFLFSGISIRKTGLTESRS
ncbi:MAG: hypothetical protein P8Y51_06380 [Campylobacterales bacterium]